MDAWICVYCESGAHARCFSREVCECVHEPEPWLTPDRRAALREGALPVNQLETGFQDAFFAHRADRAAAEERRG